MTFLGTLPQAQRQNIQDISTRESDPDALEPGFFEGMPAAAGAALGRIVGTASRAAGELEYQVGSIFTRPIDELFGTGYTDVLNRELRVNVERSIAEMTPDPYTTGTAGQILFGLVGIGGSAGLGGYLGGPAGAMWAAGGYQGIGTYSDLKAQGVDTQTALGAATFEGAMMAGGVGLPAAIGRNVLANTLIFGPGINVGQGLLTSAGVSEILESGGYGELAAHYGALNSESIIADAVLGAGFGYFGARGRGPIDAALTVVSRRNAQLDTAPGIPADAAALQSHARNLEAATEAMLNGRKFEAEPLSGQFAERPPTPQYEGDEFFRAIRESGYAELLDDIKGLEADLLARGRTLDDEALPELSRRSEDSEVARLRDLRAQWKEGKLNPAQYDELQALETKDRLTGKVGGRRIEQVRNLEAYTEDLDAGRLLPVQGFMDADNFKALNDELGHGAGDQAIAMIGRAMVEELGEGRVFHRSGDEFIFQGASKAELDAAAGRIRARLEQAELVATRADGSTVSRKGIRFSYGLGKTIEEAEDAQYADKKARKDAGLRTDRPPEQAPDAQRGGEGLGEQGRANREGRDQAPAEVEAQRVVQESPDIRIVDDAGAEVKAADALKQGEQIVAEAERDSLAYDAAINCFMRNGG